MRAVLVDFDTSGPRRGFDSVRPIGILLERVGSPGFDSMYLEGVTDGEDPGHDNYVRTMQAVELFREMWDKGEAPQGVTEATETRALLTYLADNSYLGVRLRSLGLVPDETTLGEAFETYVVRAEALPVSDDEEFPVEV